MTPLAAEQVRSLRDALRWTVLLSGILVAGILLTGGWTPVPVLFALSGAAALPVASRVSDDVLLRFRDRAQALALAATPIVVAAGPQQIAVAHALIFLLVAVLLPFTTPYPRVLAFHVEAVTALIVSLVLAGAGASTVMMLAAAYGLAATLSSRSAADLGDALVVQTRSRDVEAAVSRLIDTAVNLDDVDERAVPHQFVESIRSLGFARVGLQRVLASGVVDLTGDLDAATVARGLAQADHGGRAGRVDLGDGREAVVIRIDRYGAPFVSVVAVAEPGERVADEHVELLDQVAGLATRWVEAAARIADQRRRLDLLAELEAHKDDVVSSVSHELRTPLTVIKGLAETFRDRGVAPESPQGRQLLSRLEANAARLESVVGTILDLSRLSAGSVQLETAQVDLARLVRDAAERLAPLSDVHRIEVDADEITPAVADASLLEHVLENLLVNAIKHTPAGTTIRLGVRSRGAVVITEVADDGPGISPDELARVTERFFRGRETTQSQVSGLGLGLALVDRILAAHGTVLEVSSQLGRGTRFSFVLPLADGLR